MEDGKEEDEEEEMESPESDLGEYCCRVFVSLGSVLLM